MIPESEPEKRAPGRLRLVQQFLNSAQLEDGRDDIPDPPALEAWLEARDLLDPEARATEADWRRAIDVREGLRAVIATHNGRDADPEAIERLERASAQAGLQARFEGSRPSLAPSSSGVNAGIARLLAEVTLAAADGAWDRLKACAKDDCRWAFYDHTRNRSGRWCSMASCGNQHKARAFRERARSSKS